MERTKEQQIIFQNQSHLVQKWFNDCGVCPTLFDLALATDVMVDFALKGPEKEVIERFTKLEKYLEGKKNERKQQL